MAGSNGRQAFATDAAAIGQCGLAALARIAVEKPVLPFAADFRRLILAFHKSIWLPSGGKTGTWRIAMKRLVSRRGSAGLLATAQDQFWTPRGLRHLCALIESRQNGHWDALWHP
jgi:hypothetical protein